MEVKDWVRAARARMGWSGEQLGERLGRSKGTIGHWETGKHRPSYDQMLMISSLTGMPMPELDAHPVDIDHNGDYPAVRRVRFKLSAGVSGFQIESADEDGPPIVFRRDWFDLHGYRPDKLLAARVTGASMEPTLYEGDIAVINTAQVTPKDGRAFAINYEGMLAIKRLVRDAGEWWLRSDNPDKRYFADKRAHDGVSIIGEIVYRQSERI